MSNGNHFTPGIPLAATASFTGTDVDTATAALQLAVTRGLVFIGANAPTVTESPDWQQFLWASPYVDNSVTKYTLKMYNSTTAQWYTVLTALPDLYLSSIKAVAADVGKVPVVTFDGLNYTPTWTTFVPSNIPATALTPAAANQIIATNSAGTACYWTSLANLLSAVGRVVTLDNLVIGAATAGQVPTYTGGTIKWQTPYSAATPTADNLSWVAANNNIEVWDTQNSKTVLKSRKQFVDTIPTDISAGAIVGSTKLLGFDVSGLSPVGITTTVSAIKDYALADIATLLTNKPNKFYSTVVDIVMDASGTTMNTGAATPFFAGIPHGLGATPSIIGAKIICKTVSGTLTVVGQSVDSRDVVLSQPGGTYICFWLRAKADATNIYLWEKRAAVNSGLLAPDWSFVDAYSSIIQQIQLYAIL